MKIRIVLIGIAVTFFSCGKSVEDNLAEGLENIEHTRLIEHTFMDNYSIDKMVFLKEEGDGYPN